MDFRADLVINQDNTQEEMMQWFEAKYKAHSGTKRDFVRFLVNELYQREKEEKTITQKDIDKIKEEVLDYVLKYLNQEGLKEEITKKINDLDENQIDAQDKMFGQF
ncbi:hypothetical protein [Halonatronum saccharophilum]|uniref:hypothetical protein n=1 Tax=Halonatronum saccharophilum TaxID=150060 RepID=UPI0004841948|nr:hypothetical protein [Halonatronum saccharophilum]